MPELLIAGLLFVLGLAMSFFFSGTEIAFYRISTVRLTIEATAGDRAARRLLKFAQRPGRFVATTLVGNNVANDLVTIGTALGAASLVGSEGLAEVIGTWAVTPVVFVLGELLPKSICYLTPSWILRRGGWLFQIFYWFYLPVSLPLAMISHLLERLAGNRTGTTDLVFGRSRLNQVFRQGRRAGLLTDAQGRFLTGLLTASGETIADAMTSADTILGLPDDVDRDAVLEHARRFGLIEVSLFPPDRPGEWTHSVRVAELALSDRPLRAHRRLLPRFEPQQVKLEVLLALRTSGDTQGVVVRNGRAIGLVNERGLVEALFRAGRPLAVGSAV
ncbi:MAG: DUF21 domain-containing protein [Planctomycetaceae bacterium]